MKRMTNWVSKLISRFTKKEKNLDTMTNFMSKSSDIFYPEGSLHHYYNSYKPKPGEKRVYKIEVGNISPEEVEEYINKIAQRFKQHATNDTSAEGGVL
jgi:predicted CopG family antitoxin